MVDRDSRAARHMYRTDPASFFGLAFRLLYPRADYLDHWSIEVLGDVLARCLRGATRRVIVNMPPRSLKSICASVAFPAWVLGVRPETKIACVAGHRGLADDHHELTRRLMLHPKYRALFPHVRIQTTANTIRLPHGGLRSAFTPTGAITGRGADLIIIDDPQVAHEADDRSNVESIRRWYDLNVYQRLNDKAKGVVILVTQRLAHDDLTAHLLAKGGWELLSLPAIATADEQFPKVFGPRVVRKKGEVLHPAREDRDQHCETLLRIGATAFMAQYQQDPYPPGGPQGGGVYTVLPHPGATDEELKGAPFFFGDVPEEWFVSERVFGEFSGVRRGPPPAMTTEEWLQRYSSDSNRDRATAG